MYVTTVRSCVQVYVDAFAIALLLLGAALACYGKQLYFDIIMHLWDLEIIFLQAQ